MKKLVYTFLAFVTMIITLNAALQAQTLVDDWGATSRGNGWPILNTVSTAAGDAGMGAAGPPPTWATIRGGFDSISISLGETFVITGKLEYAGGGVGESYVGLRYALTYQDSATLENQNTDSAMWVSTQGHYGYEFTPRAGGTDLANGAGGSGTIWTVNGAAGWNSTFSNNGAPFGTVLQAPRLADIVEGVYDFAISVQKLTDSTNEVRWYLVEQNNEYWFGGTAIDTSQVTNKFNGICFGVGDGITTTLNQLNLTNVNVGKGSPITIPEAPWEAFYVSDWGATSRGNGWPILNDSSSLVGDASMGAAGPPATWATIRGGFGEAVTATTDKAIIVSGQLEYAGGGVGESYVGLRYALTFQDSATLENQYTDSAMWVSTQGHYGYELTPRAGGTDLANGNGGSGTIWTVNGAAGWNSTYSNNGLPFGTVLQAPRLADIVEGVYDFAISVRPLGDGTNEVKWYLVEVNNNYWFGGTAIDTAQVTTKFNGICFGIGDGITTTLNQFNLIAVKVDKGDPIAIPEAPWQAYYVDSWGFFGDKMGGWTFTPGQLTGNATISGNAPNTDWAALRGEFQTFTPSESAPLKITGKVNFEGGGFDVSSSFRLGIFYTDSAGTLVVDTVAATLPDSTHWTGTDNHSSGYLFLPQSGSNGPVNWNGGAQGTWGAVVDTTWLSPEGSNNYVLGSEVPNPSTGGAGTYDFEISVTPQGNGTSIVKCNFTNGNFNWVVSVVDNHNPLVTDKFNSIAFALDAGNSITAMNITDVQIDTGTVTAVDEPGSTLIPMQFELSQNYPNPFNPTTTIQFALPKASEVHLIVYDILGRVVSTLINGNMNAGYHKVNFNASNLASGVYFYSIKAGDYTNVKKLMLLK